MGTSIHIKPQYKKRICFLTDSIFSIGGVQRVTAVIAKELTKDYDVTIVTFDRPDMQDTTLYGLSEASVNYRFFRYPKIGKVKKWLCKAYSGYYRKMQLHGKVASNLYALSSFPSELREALTQELLQGHYDTIIGVHAPLAARLATLMSQLPDTRCIGWIHNSFEALFSPASRYIGPDLKRHYFYQFRRLHVTVCCASTMLTAIRRTRASSSRLSSTIHSRYSLESRQQAAPSVSWLLAGSHVFTKGSTY